MAQILKLRRSNVPGKIPDTGSLDFGEIALNTYDGLAYMKKSGSSGEQVVVIGTGTSGSFTGSFFGTASWANNATSSSYTLSASLAQTASYVLNAISSSYAATASSADNFLVRGTLTAQTIVVQTITSSVDFVTGSTIFGTLLSNTHQFTGSVSISGSLNVTGAGITGSLFGTSSFANTASFALRGSGSFTGSFTGSFVGDGSRLTNISASSVVGLNLSRIASGSVTASVDPAYGFRVNSNSEISGSLQVTGSVGITGSLSLLGNTGSVLYSNADTIVMTGSFYQSGSNYINGLLEITGSLRSQSITGSLLGTASWANNAITASYILNAVSASYALSASQAQSAVTASYVLNAISASYALSSSNARTASYAISASQAQNAGTASNVLGGTATYIPFWKTDTTLGSSAMYQISNSFSVTSIAINETNITSANPEALYVFQSHPTSINVLTGKGNLNNYLQNNIQNTNQGVSASSDVVATANNGNETSNYIDMGINSQNYSQGFIGSANDAYLYSIANNLHIGNANDNGTHIGFFVGGSDVDAFNKLQLNPDDQHTMSGSLDISGSLIVKNGITGSLFGTASWARNSQSASQAQNSVTASHAVSALSSSFSTTAITASYADSFTVAGTLTAQTIVVQTITSSIDFVTGSTRFGSLQSNTHQFTGSVSVTGSFNSNNATITGSLFGTASWAGNAISSSYALSASQAQNAVSASFATSASQAQNAVSSSYPFRVTGSTLVSVMPAGGVGGNTNNSIFFGSSAGNNATNANFSNYIGFFAGNNATNANFSNYIGRGAGSSATNAAYSNFIGSAAGDTATNAIRSNFIGDQSGQYATNAEYSNFIGYNAGSSATSASYSTLIGYQAGYNSSGAALGVKSNNIIIGTNITLADGRQDSLNVGGLIFGTGSYSTTTGNPFSGSANGRIGINQPLPIFSLDVSGSGRYTNGLQVTGSLNAPMITGSLFGTSSWASNSVTSSYVLNAVSASYSITSSLPLSGIITASVTGSTITFIKGDNSAFNVVIATATSETASYVSSSNVDGPFGKNSVLSASYSVTSSLATSASYSVTSSYATYAQTASYAVNVTVSGSITDVDYIDFDTNASFAAAIGRLGYDSGEGTLTFGLAGGNVTLKIGSDLYQYVYNNTTSSLTLGQVVYVSGSQGNRIAVKLASATAEQGSANTLGFVAETIGAGAEGWVLTEGNLRKLNTTGLIGGGLIYLGVTPGTYTQTIPVAPNHGVRLGYAERIDNTVGSIYVKIDNGYELGELHDVVDSTTSSSFGDLLVRSGSVWINSKQLTGSYGLTGSINAVGSITLVGTQIVTGSINVSGSQNFIGTSTSTGNQIVTGSLITSGSNILIGNTYLTGSVNISGSTIQTGNNTLLGSTTLSGSITVSGSLNASANLTLQGHLRLDPGQDPGNNNFTASYLFTSASNTATGYDLYYRQDGNLIKFKWLEGGLSSGILYGGTISYSGSVIYVKKGSGIINNMNATTGSEINPIITYVNWNDYTASAQYLTSSQVTYLYASSNGTISQQTSYFDQTQYEQAIPLGLVTHPNYTTIASQESSVQTTYDSDTQQNDFIRAFGPIKVSGFTPFGQSGSLRINIGSGTGFVLGGFYSANQNSPSHYTATPAYTASLARAYRSGSEIYLDSNNGAYYTVVDPSKYDTGTGLSNVSGTNTSIQRIFYNPITKQAVVYYGQNTYTSIPNALAALPSDSFTEGEFTSKALIFVGYLIVQGNASDLSNTGQALFIQAGVFRNIAGGSSGAANVAQTLDDLSDVTITTPTNGQALIYNGGVWINGTPLNATTASYSLTALSSSFAASASRAQDAATASYVLNAVSSSFATTASYVSNALSASFSTFAVTSSFANNFTVAGTLTAQTIVVQTITSSIEFVTGSTRFGTLQSNTHQFTGSVSVTDSLNAPSITGSLQGTASWASSATNTRNAISSSYPLSVVSDSLITPLQTSNYGTTRNVFIGFFVGSNTTGVSDAVFIGSSAGAEATNSAGSVFIGGGAGYAITKPQTVAIGASAGFNSTNAQYSLFIGTNAGNSSTNASQSVFLGYESGIQSSNAYNSTFVGYQSGYQASNANNSVLIGFKSGYNASGVGISSNNIIIGTNITLANSRQDSINIGGLVFGTGSYSTTTGNPFSGSANGRIGINQPLPIFSLDVSGSGRYTNGLQVTGSLNAPIITGSLFGTASWANNVISASYVFSSVSASFASTASSVNTLNQNVIITGSLTVGATSVGANENTLTLGPAPAGGAGEGAQLMLQAKGDSGYTSASMLDTYQNSLRILRGTNAGSDDVHLTINLHTGRLQFTKYTSTSAFSGTAVANLSVDSSGNVLTTAIGSSLTGGSTNYVARWASSTTLTTGSLFDNGTNVGLGNTSPSYKLDVTGDIRATGAIYANANGAMYFQGGDDAALYDINLSNHMGIYGVQDSTVASIKLGSGGGILSGRSGSIGIGTTSPTLGTLQVNGNVYATSFTGSLQGTSSWSNNAVTSSYVLSSVSASFASTASNVLGGAASYIPLWNTATSLSSSTIYQSGENVAINQTTVGAKLDIANSSNGSTNNIFQRWRYVPNNATFYLDLKQTVTTGVVRYNFSMVNDGYAYNDVLVLDRGNVGIGTTTPNAKLDVNGNAIVTGSLTVTGDITAQTLVVQTVTSSVSFITGSSRFGSLMSNTHQFTGSVSMTGSLTVIGAGITGSLFGTSSWASNATTASYVLNAVSSSFASTASFTQTAATASYSTNFTVANQLTIDATLTDYATVASSVVGSNNLFTQATGSYTSAFFKYTVSSGSNSRAGEVVGVWNGASVQYYDNSTVDVGNTTVVTSSVSVVGGDVQFNVQTNSSGWRIKSLATFM